MSETTLHQKSSRPVFLERLSPLGWLGILIITFWVLIAIIGPWISPHRPGRIVDFNGVFGPMSAAFPLGSDYMGRDILSRIIDGTRYTLGVSLAATIIASACGTALGLLAAVTGGWLDTVISRIMDSIISLPSTIFALVIIAGLGSNIPVLIGVSALLYTPGIYRVARAASLNVTVMDFIEVAKARGERTPYIMLREVLPNMMPPVLTDFGVRFIYIMLLISGLGFLGLGIQPPNADWGTLVYENLAGVGLGAPAAFLPALCIMSLALAVNLVVDAASDFSRSGSSEL